jgi:hypothetical protein
VRRISWRKTWPTLSSSKYRPAMLSSGSKSLFVNA